MAKSSHNSEPSSGKSWKKTRENVLKRDENECKFCGVSNEQHKAEYNRELSAHHIIPKSDGGSDTEDNLVTVCSSCHKTIEEIHGKAMHELLNGIFKTTPSNQIDHLWDRVSKVSDLVNEYLDKHPTIRDERGIYPGQNEVNLTDLNDMYSVDIGDFEIDSEYQLLITIGYLQGMEEYAAGLDDFISTKAVNCLDD